MSAVQDHDLGLKRFVKEMKRAQAGSNVKIGVQADSRYIPDPKTGRVDSGETDLVAVASANEFGTGTIPERSFIRSTTDEERKNVDRLIDKGLDKIKQGHGDVRDVLDRVGLYMTAKIQKKIVDLRTPPNAPATVARKGSSNPLIDTGQLRQSITHITKVRG